MKIGELARRLGVATSKIRFLEASGLIPPADRAASGYRDYDAGAVEKVELILLAQSFGFSLDEIRRGFAEAKGRESRCDYLVERMKTKLQIMDRDIAQAQAARTRLAGAVAELEARSLANKAVEPRDRVHAPLRAQLGPAPVRRLRRNAAGR